METRAMVMSPKNGGIMGRYICYDGYLEGAGTTLLEIVTRDGLDMAREILVMKTPSWLCLKTGPEWLLRIHEDLSLSTLMLDGNIGDMVKFPGSKNSYLVNGYGKSEIWGEMIDYSNMEEYVGSSEWIYVLEDGGLRCAKITHNDGADDISWFSLVSWSTRPSDLADLVKLEICLATS